MQKSSVEIQCIIWNQVIFYVIIFSFFFERVTNRSKFLSLFIMNYVAHET